VEKRVEVPIESVKVEMFEKIIEKLVEVPVEKIVEVPGKDDDCECITEVKFIQLWNKMMSLKFSDVKEECLSDDKFLDLLLQNF